MTLNGSMVFKTVIKLVAQLDSKLTHSCWQAVSSDCPPFATQANCRQTRESSSHPTALSSYCRSAILAAILSRKTLIRSRAGKCIDLTPREASQILNGLDYSTISPLLALECECRCKTALATVCKNCVKNVYIYFFFLHLDLPTLYVATRKHPMLYLGT